jgi:hypothetical protein
MANSGPDDTPDEAAAVEPVAAAALNQAARRSSRPGGKTAAKAVSMARSRPVKKQTLLQWLQPRAWAAGAVVVVLVVLLFVGLSLFTKSV